MYFEVAVGTAKDRAHDTFTYYSDKALKLGSIVEVPFGKQTTQGVVWQQTETPTVKNILPVLRVIVPEQIIGPKLRALFGWMADYYQTTISSVVAIAVPDFPKKPLAFGSRQIPIKQTLLLAPTVYRLKQIEGSLKKRGKTCLLYHGDLHSLERAQVYQQAFTGQAGIIAATRVGLFLPFHNLKKIFLYDEHDWSFKEQHTPQFHAATVACALAQIHHADYTIIDPTPRIQTLQQAKRDPSLMIKQPPLPLGKDQITIVDLTNESKKGNPSIISENLGQAIYSALAKRQPILLYLNKKNDGGMLFCKYCQTTSYLADATARVTTPCPVCNSTETKIIVLNLKTLARDVQKLLTAFGVTKGLWQSEARGSIIRFIIPKKSHQPHRQTKTTSGVALITIATQKIAYQADTKSFGLLGIILIDVMLNQPEFRAAEMTFANLANLSSLVAKSGKMIIQTRQPDYPVLAYFAKQDYQGFANAELADRQSLGYPPFTSLALLSFKAKSPATAMKHAKALCEQLDERKRQLELSTSVILDLIGDPFLADIKTKKDSRLRGNDNGGEIEPIGPFTPLHNETEARILLKAKNRAALTPFLQIVPKNWRINLDPEKIVT